MMLVPGIVPLQAGLYLYPRNGGPSRATAEPRSLLGGCRARPGCGCSSTSLLSLHPGDVVRLELDSGLLATSQDNSFVMYLVEEGRQEGRGSCGDTVETCHCNCKTDCCSSPPGSEQSDFYGAPGDSGYRTTPSTDSDSVIYITTPRYYYPSGTLTPPPQHTEYQPTSPGSHYKPSSYEYTSRGTVPTSDTGIGAGSGYGHGGDRVVTGNVLGGGSGYGGGNVLGGVSGLGGGGVLRGGGGLGRGDGLGGGSGLGGGGGLIGSGVHGGVDGVRGKCCPRLSIRLGSVSGEFQYSKEGEYELVRDTVYRQDMRDSQGGQQNFIFYVSHPSWAGWLVGPKVLDQRGGLLSRSVSPCPTQADGWQFFSPQDGFQPGEVQVSCVQWPEEPASYHVHHHYHHQDVQPVSQPGYTISSDGNTVDARFVFPDKRFVNSSDPVPSV